MKLCNDDCQPVCDFCLNYKDDGAGLFSKEGRKGKFEGEGLCIKKNIRVEADGMCKDDFECIRTL